MNGNFVMEVKLCEEAGHKSALRGLSLNKKQNGYMMKVAERLAHMDGGHNKFLESIIIWMEVTAPRYWWQEADTYRLSTKQSESTMHTLEKELKTHVIPADLFEGNSVTNKQWEALVKTLEIDDPVKRLVVIKQLLPEGFLQKRMWCMSYKTLRNIVAQRSKHKLPHWPSFITQTLDQIRCPEYIVSQPKSEESLEGTEKERLDKRWEQPECSGVFIHIV